MSTISTAGLPCSYKTQKGVGGRLTCTKHEQFLFWGDGVEWSIKCMRAERKCFKNLKSSSSSGTIFPGKTGC